MAPSTLPGWAHPYRDPSIFYADGGDDPAPEPVVAVDPEPDDGPADDWQPPTREEYEKLVEGKRKADAEAASRRKYLRQHGIDPKTGEKATADEPEPEPVAKGDQPPGVSAAEVKRQIEKAAAEAELRSLRKTKALVTGVNGALSEAGWNGSRLNSLMKLLDLDDVEVDDDGEISGLSEQIDAIKAEWPEFFKRTRQVSTASNSAAGSGQNGAPAAKVDTADKPAPKPEPKGWAETLAERALRS
ncbi:phage scaffolding protein [Streptomyces sp. NPDC002920]